MGDPAFIRGIDLDPRRLFETRRLFEDLRYLGNYKRSPLVLYFARIIFTPIIFTWVPEAECLRIL